MYTIFRSALAALALSCGLVVSAGANEPEQDADTQSRLAAEQALDAAFTQTLQEVIENAMRGELDRRLAEQIADLDSRDPQAASHPASRTALNR